MADETPLNPGPQSPVGVFVTICHSYLDLYPTLATSL